MPSKPPVLDKPAVARRLEPRMTLCIKLLTEAIKEIEKTPDAEPVKTDLTILLNRYRRELKWCQDNQGA